MIEYQPNRSWLRDLRHLGTSWTLRRLLRGVLAVGLYAVCACVVVIEFGLEGQVLSTSAFSLLGIILSIILVFRTNTAYDRWYEGRKQWGHLLNQCRGLAMQLGAALPEAERGGRQFFARQIANFARSMVSHLRGEPGLDGLIEPDDRDTQAASRGEHLPNHFALRLTEGLQVARRDNLIDEFDLQSFRGHLQEFLEVLGACERIRNTPIPFSYAAFIKVFITVYALILPFGLIPDYGYLAVPLTMFVFFALAGVELMAGEIEDPFGLDCNDLPTSAIADSIRRDAEALLGLREVDRPPPEPAPYAKVF